jgi:hypothetical protein
MKVLLPGFVDLFSVQDMVLPLSDLYGRKCV